MLRNSLLKLGLAVGALGIAAAGATVAVAQSGDTQSMPTPTAPAISALAALGSPPSAKDTLPPRVAEFVKGDRPAADLTSARLAVSRERRTVYLVRDGDSICIPVVIEQGPTTLSCELMSVINDGGNRPIQIGFSDDQVTLLNVVPDNVPEVSVTFASGKTASVPVENNVYLLNVPFKTADPPKTVSYHAGSTSVSFSAELTPPTILAE